MNTAVLELDLAQALEVGDPRLEPFRDLRGKGQGHAKAPSSTQFVAEGALAVGRLLADSRIRWR